VLAAHPSVEEVIVTGVPSELGDEDVKAWIIASGEKPAEADLIVWCTTRLAAFKIPRYIAFVRDFPRSATKRDVERAKVKAWSDQDHWDRERQPGGRLFGKP
jgi:crotonobetaine/carnitine-CoA ligase